MTIESTKENAWKTAIGRKAPSVPMRRLATEGVIKGRSLDYGCGRGFDAKHFGMESYDPHYQPDKPDGLFETITCNYVLNVLESDECREYVLRDIQSRLTDDGVAYITVRNDKKRLNGVTSKGTWQGLVVLDLPVKYKSADYITYELSKDSQL